VRSGYVLREPCRGDGVPRAFAERREEEHARAAQLGALHAIVPHADQLGGLYAFVRRAVRLWSLGRSTRALGAVDPDGRGPKSGRGLPYSVPTATPARTVVYTQRDDVPRQFNAHVASYRPD
jgi:hypothetical protein